MTDFIACVSYYSLPAFHENCNLVRNHNLLLRDVLTCNPANHHVSLGGQYDPHYETPEYKMCWPNARTRIWKEINNKKFENIFLIFRTCLKNPYAKRNSHHISGFYEVDQALSRINPDYNSPQIIAKRAHFVIIEDSIDLGYFYEKTPNPKSRFPFYSDTREGEYLNDLKSWLEIIESKPNRVQEYTRETLELKKKYILNEYSPKSYYSECDNCESCEKCLLIKRIDEKKKVRDYISKKEAEKIYSFMSK